MDDGVLRYRPRMVSHDTWERIGPVVRTLALLTKTVGAPQRTSDLMGPLVRLAAWAEEAGIPLDAAELSAPPTVLRYILSTEGLTSVSRRSQKSTLNRMVEAVRFNKYGEQPPVQLSAKTSPTRPYQATEEATWLIWAQSMTTALQRRNAVILLALGRGCGVAAEDLAHMTGRHVQRGPSGRAIVTIPGKRGCEHKRAREVVCRYRYERMLLDIAAPIGPDEWLFRPDWSERDSRHLVTGWTEKFQLQTGRGERETIQLQRLRNGWIVELMDCHIPLQVIIESAGLQTLHSISRLVTFLQTVSREDAAIHLRGAPPGPPGPPAPKASRRAA